LKFPEKEKSREIIENHRKEDLAIFRKITEISDIETVIFHQILSKRSVSNLKIFFFAMFFWETQKKLSWGYLK
jgi:hypothetical protein